ncbi:hypothetical protein BA899_09790 [Spiribacter sp. SSL99]|nr:hypothetical protein BA899_09790 [Spiribacter sp. SSL99]
MLAKDSVKGQNGDMESSATCAAEAAASLVVVTMTNHNGFRDRIAGGDVGLLVVENDMDGIAAEMPTLLNDPATRQRAAPVAHASSRA